MSYLVNELLEKAVVLSKNKFGRADIEAFCKVVYDYVSNTKKPLFTLPQVTGFFSSNYKDVKNLCLNDILTSDYFPGKVELLFGLACFDDAIESQIFNKFSEALGIIYSKTAKSKDNTPSVPYDAYEKAMLKLPYDLVELFSEELLNPKPVVEEKKTAPPQDFVDVIREGRNQKPKNKLDFSEKKSVQETSLLPANFPVLSDFVFNTLEYLTKVKSSKLKDYCLEVFNNPSKDFNFKPINPIFFDNLYLFVLHYLESGKFDLSSERPSLKHRLYELNERFPFIKKLEGNISKSICRIILTYLADNRLLDYSTIDNFIIKWLGADDWATIWPFVKSIVNNYPGLIQNSVPSVSDIKSFRKKFKSLNNKDFNERFPESLLEFDSRFSDSAASVEVTEDVIVFLSDELYSLEKHLKHYSPKKDVINCLDHLLYLINPLTALNKKYKSLFLKSRWGVESRSDGVIYVYNDLLKNLNGLTMDIDNDYAKSAHSISRLFDLVNDSALRIDIFNCLNDLHSSLNSLKNGLSAPSIEMQNYLNSILGSAKKKGVSNWLSNIKARPAFTQLSLEDKLLLLKDLDSWHDSLVKVAMHIKHL